jgi:hypothetical protein
MANPAVTYTFSNSTTADATQVNQNFTDLINGLTDGTKDLSISAITAAGTATFNGAVNLGNASSDDLTITASLASTVAIKTTYSYDIGSSSIGLRSLYLGSADSAARGTRLIGATVASGYTFTLPTSGGTVGQHLTTDGSGTTSWRYGDKSTAKTTTYTATGDETVITCDATSAAFTVTLPAAASFTGKRYVIKKTDSTLNAVTIDGNASETIDGATTTTLNTQYESVEIVCDGSNWHIVQRHINSVWSTGLSLTPNNFGTVSNTTYHTRRIRDSLEVVAYFIVGTPAASAASLTLPTGLAIDTTKLNSNSGSTPNASQVGDFNELRVGANDVWGDNFGKLFYDGSTTDRVFFAIQSGGVGYVKNNANGFTAAGDAISLRFTVPISGWKG